MGNLFSRKKTISSNKYLQYSTFKTFINNRKNTKQTLPQTLPVIREEYTNPGEALYEKTLSIAEKEAYINGLIQYLIKNKDNIINNNSFGQCIGELNGHIGFAACESMLCDRTLSF